MRRALLLLLACPLLPAQDRNVPIGTVVDAPFTDQRWQPRRLADLGDTPAKVVFFATVDCPLVLRYLPRIQELALAQAAKGVPVLVVNVGPGDSLVDACGQVVEFAPAAVAGKDFDGAFARACGVGRTASALVLDRQHRIAYRGRVDAQYGYGGASPAVPRHDLAEALAQVLAGEAVAVPATDVAGCMITWPAAPPAAAAPPTFSKDIAPLLQRHCQECHRDGGSAPFALATFADAKKHAAMIGEVTAQGRMPPWYGSSKHGDFTNHRGLDAGGQATCAAWVVAGAPEGDPNDLPPPRQWPTAEWRIGSPDLVIKTLAPTRLPADGYVPYKYFVLPHRFEQDTWVEALEILPANKRVLHHCNLAHVKWGEKWSQDGFITGQVPGGDAMVLDPGTAVRIPAGSVLVLQAHYVTTGEVEEDRLRVGLRFPRVPVQKELHVQIVADFRFAIPPGAPAQPSEAQRRFREDAIGIGMFAHMHMRGRDMKVTATPEGGADETLLLVPNYSFDWQQSYRWAPGQKRFAKGTRVRALAHFDNSRWNPFNPDPEATVRFGQETFDEMMYLFLFYVHEHEQLGLQVDPASGCALAPAK